MPSHDSKNTTGSKSEPSEARTPHAFDAESSQNATEEERAEASRPRATNEQATTNAPRWKQGRRLFGIQRSTPYEAEAGGGNDPYDYEKKYPEDSVGDEMGQNARVWRTYLDESMRFDGEMLSSWKDTIDVLLVFAGLFSAVVTTFVVQTAQSLQPNYTQILVSLASEQIALQRAAAAGTSPNDIPASSLNATTPFVAEASDKWVNGLWFMSLAFSLSSALLAVLIKQWLQHYVNAISGTAVQQVRIRQFRFMGLQRWHVAGFIGTLLPLLQIALLLYFAGLIIFLWNLDISMAAAVLSVAGTSYMFSIGSNFLPLCWPQCPYRTPLTESAFEIIHTLWAAYSRYFVKTKFHHPLKSSNSISVLQREMGHVSHCSDEMDAEAMLWLYSSSSNPTVHSIVLQALSGLHLGFRRKELLANDIVLTEDLKDIVRRYYNRARGTPDTIVKGRVARSLKPGTTAKSERLSRSLLQLYAQNLPIPYITTRLPVMNALSMSDSLVLSGTQTESPQATALGYISYPKENAPYFYEVPQMHEFVITCIESYQKLPTFTYVYLLCRALTEVLNGQHHPTGIHWSRIVLCIGKLDYGFLYDLSLLAPITDLISYPKDERHLKSELSIRYLYSLLYPQRTGKERVINVREMFVKVVNFALRAICAEDCQPSKCGYYLDILLGSLTRSHRGLRQILYGISEGVLTQEDIRPVAAAYMELRVALGAVIGWHSFPSLTLDLQSRFIKQLGAYFAAPVHGNLIPTQESSAFIPSRDLLERLLRFPPLETDGLFNQGGFTWTYSTFSLLAAWFESGDLGAIRSFRELEGLEKWFDLTPRIPTTEALHENMAYAFYTYVSAILKTHSKDDGDHESAASSDDDLQYIFRTDNLSRIIRSFGWFLVQPLWSYPPRDLDHPALRLGSDIRKTLQQLVESSYDNVLPPDWKVVLVDVVRMTRLHEQFHYSNRERPALGYEMGYQCFLSTITATIKSKRLDALDDELNLYEYVCGKDVEDVPMCLSHLDGLRMYAPYTVPFRPSYDTASTHGFHGSFVSNIPQESASRSNGLRGVGAWIKGVGKRKKDRDDDFA